MVFLIWVMLWGMVQLDVARNGYILFIPASKIIVEDNYLIRRVAFISSTLQARTNQRGGVPESRVASAAAVDTLHREVKNNDK